MGSDDIGDDRSTELKPEQQAALNTDRELWRKEDSYYAPSIHVTQQGSIGIDVGGTVHVMPVEKWHALAERANQPGVSSKPEIPPDLQALYEKARWHKAEIKYSAKHKPHPYDRQTTLVALIERTGGAESEVAQLRAEVETTRETLGRIESWCQAYPIEVFIEPDWKEVARLLGDTLLTQVSAANMRHVVNGIQRIISRSQGAKEQGA